MSPVESWYQPVRPVFVDTSAWIALFCRRETFHMRAREHWERIQHHRRQLVTSDYVLDETYTLLRRRRNGLALARAVHQLMETSEVIQVEMATREILERAWSLFSGYEDQVLSFTDCVSFAQMQALDLLEAFSFDADFRRAGFVLSPVQPE